MAKKKALCTVCDGKKFVSPEPDHQRRDRERFPDTVGAEKMSGDVDVDNGTQKRLSRRDRVRQKPHHGRHRLL